MNKYLLYKVNTGDLTLVEYECPEIKEEVNIDPNTLKELSYKELSIDDIKGLRYSGLINEYFYNVMQLPFEQFFIAVEHKKGRYYSNELHLKNNRLVGSLPSFWTNFKYATYVTILLVTLIFLACLIANFLCKFL